MKHSILLVILALLLSACVRSASAPVTVTLTPKYPLPSDPRPTLTPLSGPLTVTVNLNGEPQGDWAGWQIRHERTPDFLEPNCTLYQSPDSTHHWKQWIGKCVYQSLDEIFSLPWVNNDIVAAVQDADGRLVALYTSGSGR
jgi:hypothetical protein